MYNIEFIVKYKSIEEDLLEKIRNGEQDYNQNDVYEICNDLYRHELLSVFQAKSLDDPLLEKNVLNVWKIVKKNTEFMKIVEAYKERSLLCSEWVDDKDFVGLFNYDTFFLMHKCICKCLQNVRIDQELLDKTICKINKL